MNLRPSGYEPDELPAAPLRDNQASHIRCLIIIVHPGWNVKRKYQELNGNFCGFLQHKQAKVTLDHLFGTFQNAAQSLELADGGLLIDCCGQQDTGELLADGALQSRLGEAGGAALVYQHLADEITLGASAERDIGKFLQGGLQLGEEGAAELFALGAGIGLCGTFGR